MQSFSNQLAELQALGYSYATAQAKVAHDALLWALHKSGFKKNSTIKGGVVMSEITHDIRRTTMDMDIDFVRYSISEASIRRFVARLAKKSGFRISIFGTITELRQDDYRGKRLFVLISDGTVKKPVTTKIDIGVHTKRNILQTECRFAALEGERGATLFTNTKEQIFAEKLLSLLRHGMLSTRAKDVFDLYYLKDTVRRLKLKEMVDALILGNRRCPVRDPKDVVAFVDETFRARRFRRLLSARKDNWLELPPDTVTTGVLDFLRKLLLSR